MILIGYYSKSMYKEIGKVWKATLIALNIFKNKIVLSMWQESYPWYILKHLILTNSCGDR